MCARHRNVITEVLPDVDAVVAALPDSLVDGSEELRARLELAYLTTSVNADAGDVEAAIAALRARAGGDEAAVPFGTRFAATTFDDLVAAANRAVAADRLDLATVLSLQFESGSIAAARGQRLSLFLGVNAEARRVMWTFGTAELTRRGEPPERLVELGRWLLLWSEMSTLAIGEGYRATERELLARDVAARRAALDELLGAVAGDGRAGPRMRRLSMRYGLDPDAAFRLVAILPGLDVDPTPDDPGLDDEDLDILARRIDQRIRRQGARDRPGTGISVPLAVTWRGSIVAILGRDRQEFVRLTAALRDVLGAVAGSDEQPSWVAIAMAADGVRAWPRTLVELQESLRVARGIGRHGVIDDVAELGVERLLLSDPDLAATIIGRELGALLADPRMGEELVETLQVYFDAGGNRRETARRLHLADRTVAYRLERAEQLLGHGLDGEAGRRLNVALTLRRLARAAQPTALSDRGRPRPEHHAIRSARICRTGAMTRPGPAGMILASRMWVGIDPLVLIRTWKSGSTTLASISSRPRSSLWTGRPTTRSRRSAAQTPADGVPEHDRRSTQPFRSRTMRRVTRGPRRAHSDRRSHGGAGEIRTHESLRPCGFQDRRLQPLGHRSAGEDSSGRRSSRTPSGRVLPDRSLTLALDRPDLTARGWRAGRRVDERCPGARHRAETGHTGRRRARRGTASRAGQHTGTSPWARERASGPVRTMPLDPSILMSIQRSAGNGAALRAIGLARPPTVQRRVVPAEQTWLQGLLAARGGDLDARIVTDPAARVLALDPGDRMDTVGSVRAGVDAFEVAVGTSRGFGDPNAARIVSALEDSQTNDALATRLVTLFQASVDPLVGIACLVTIDLDRVRAALQGNVARTQTALTRLATRLAGVVIPGNLAPLNAFLTNLNTELANPAAAGVTASDSTREAHVEHILTPPAVAAARAAAAAAGRPPPAFVEAGYYSDMIEALHRVATDHFRSADETNRRTPMDVSAGGRVEQVALEAKRRVDGLFGVFGSSVAPRMRFGVNLFDQSAQPGNPRDMARWFVADSGDGRIQHVDETHNAFGVARANAIREDVIDHYSNTTPVGSGHPPPAGLDARLGTDGPERRRRLTLTDRMWPGMQQAGRVFLTPREGRTAAQTRRLYWNLFKTCVHEYLHTTANAAYTTWYEALQDPHHKITYQEGFTDWFTLKTWRSVFPEEVASNTAFRTLIQGSPDVDVDAARGDPPHYPEMAEAEQMETEIGLANMRAGYFRGNTAVLGGRRLPHT